MRSRYLLITKTIIITTALIFHILFSFSFDIFLICSQKITRAEPLFLQHFDSAMLIKAKKHKKKTHKAITYQVPFIPAFKWIQPCKVRPLKNFWCCSQVSAKKKMLVLPLVLPPQITFQCNVSLEAITLP